MVRNRPTSGGRSTADTTDLYIYMKVLGGHGAHSTSSPELDKREAKRKLHNGTREITPDRACIPPVPSYSRKGEAERGRMEGQKADVAE